MSNYAVIMAGGTGTRLWPMSRIAKPKQFHNLVSEKTLIQETYERVKKAVPKENVFISTNTKYEEEIKKQLPDVAPENFIIEPAKRNTAPALTYVTAKILSRDENAIIATLASDHVVNNVDVFANTVKIAFETAEKYPDYLVMVGINPTRPDTGLGYIKMGNVATKIDEEQVFEVDKFLEKPDLETAEKYIQSWEYLWNGAYYFFSGKQMMEWAKKYIPETNTAVEKIIELEKKGGSMKSITKRPWGEFEILDRFSLGKLENKTEIVIKKISVNGGSELSLQSHAKRCEQWNVICGKGEFIIGDKKTSVKVGDCAYVPQGKKHRMINGDKTKPLVVIEVDRGLFEERDIVRYRDDYGRV